MCCFWFSPGDCRLTHLKEKPNFSFLFFTPSCQHVREEQIADRSENCDGKWYSQSACRRAGCIIAEGSYFPSQFSVRVFVFMALLRWIHQCRKKKKTDVYSKLQMTLCGRIVYILLKLLAIKRERQIDLVSKVLQCGWFASSISIT